MSRVAAGAGATLAGLFLIALTLRPQIIGAGPLSPAIGDATGAPHAVVGLLGTIPVLCMGLFAPAAPHLAHRIGTRGAIAVAVALIGAFGLVRAGAPGIWPVILLTWPIGIGMGLGNALSAIAIRERFADRPGTATGVFATGIQIGSASAAAAAVPLADALGGWRAALAVFALVACLLAVAWIVLSRDWPERGDSWAPPSRLPLRNPTAWLLVTIFALMGSAYYGLSAWVPDAYVERGWSDVDVGWLIAAMNLTAVPASIVVPALSDRYGGRKPYLVVMSLVFVGAAVGLVVAPEHALAWSLVAGVSQGAMFALVMTLPIDMEVRPEKVAALIGMMLGFGYTIAAIAPFALGAVRDATGSFTASLWAVVGLLIALAVAVAALPRPAQAPR